MYNIITHKCRSDRIEFLKLILTELDYNGPVPSHLYGLVAEALLPKQVARCVGAYLLLILVLPGSLSAATAPGDGTTAATSASTSTVVVLSLLVRCLLLLLGHQVRAILNHLETLIFFVKDFLGGCRGRLLLRTHRHILEGGCHEVAHFAYLLFFVVGLI
jgi:hypothetical protein